MGWFVTQGKRLQRSPEIPDPWWDLITECWAQDAKVRPSFLDIVRKYLVDNRLIIDGTDIQAYKMYQMAFGITGEIMSGMDLDSVRAIWNN